MFEQRLRELVDRVDGANSACLVARDGIAVESYPEEPGLDLEAMAAELLNMIRRVSDEDRDPTVGQVRAFSVVGDRWTVALRAVTPNYYLLLALEREGALGRARYELRRAPLDFERDLL